MQEITKLCADHLRVFSNHQGVKLKASHAHELVAAFFGYQSRAAMLSDKEHPLSNLPKTQVIILRPSAPIDQRRKQLQGFPSDLPDSNTLGEIIYTHLCLQKYIVTPQIWSYHDIQRQAAILAYEHARSQLKSIYPLPNRDTVKVKTLDEGIRLTVSRFQESVGDPFDKYRGSQHYEDIPASIWLQRIAGHVGYAKPEISLKLSG